MRFVFLCIFLGLSVVVADERPSPSPDASPPSSPSPVASPSSPTSANVAARKVPLRFALPPMEGTISLGIFDRAGKLVRVLHREDTLSAFTAGHDALETSWDGTDDNGNPLPNGKYRARGFVVGDLSVEGVDDFFNDWVTDENSPHLKSLGTIKMEKGELQLNADLPGGEKVALACDPNTGAVVTEIASPTAEDCMPAGTLPILIAPVDCARGKDGTTWFIDVPAVNDPREVKQLSKERELLRRLTYAASDPQPQHIAASTEEEKIFLVEQNDKLQRLRALSLLRTSNESPGQSVSDWKPFFEKQIVAHQNFGLENGKPVANSATAKNPPQKVTQKLRPDPLQKDRPGKVELAIGIDEDGSFLKTADGLPLRTISDTPNLIRTLLSRPNDDSIDVFQDDGAVVEQFRISNLTEMIAFDCGDFDLK